jgi:hypothetical protein
LLACERVVSRERIWRRGALLQLPFGKNVERARAAAGASRNDPPSAAGWHSYDTWDHGPAWCLVARPCGPPPGGGLVWCSSFSFSTSCNFPSSSGNKGQSGLRSRSFEWPPPAGVSFCTRACTVRAPPPMHECTHYHSHFWRAM